MTALSDSAEVDSTAVGLRKAGCTRQKSDVFFGSAESGRNLKFPVEYRKSGRVGKSAIVMTSHLLTVNNT